MACLHAFTLASPSTLSPLYPLTKPSTSFLSSSSFSTVKSFEFFLSRQTLTKRASRNPISPAAQQTPDTEAENIGTAGTAAIVGGLIANPVVGWSLFTLKETGCGLPPGPGGSIGALEGVSYLVILGIIGWSTYSKVKKGSGLPSGPYGLLGAVEGLSFLSVLGVLVVFGLQYYDYGFIPGPVPSDLCFGPGK